MFKNCTVTDFRFSEFQIFLSNVFGEAQGKMGRFFLLLVRQTPGRHGVPKGGVENPATHEGHPRDRMNGNSLQAAQSVPVNLPTEYGRITQSRVGSGIGEGKLHLNAMSPIKPVDSSQEADASPALA